MLSLTSRTSHLLEAQPHRLLSHSHSVVSTVKPLAHLHNYPSAIHCNPSKKLDCETSTHLRNNLNSGLHSTYGLFEFLSSTSQQYCVSSYNSQSSSFTGGFRAFPLSSVLTCFSSSDTGNEISGGPIEKLWSRGVGIEKVEYVVEELREGVRL